MHRTLTLALLLAMGLASPAAGQEGAYSRAPNTGFGLSLLAGLEGYTGGLAPLIDPGPAWGIKLTGQATPRLGLEAAYSGSQSQLDASLPNDAGTYVLRTTGTVDLRVSLLPRSVEPYVFAGIGISRASVMRRGSSGFDSDTFGVVPLGAGVDFHTGSPLLIGARASWSEVFGGDVSDREGQEITGNTWNAGLSLGAVF